MSGERGSFSPDYVEAVKAGHNLATYAEQFLSWDMRKSNAAKGDWWACCPAHQERTASFHVSEPLQRFNCFGCGESGDLFDLARILEGRTFREAVEYFADGRDDLDGERAAQLAEERLERRRQADRERQAEEEGRSAKAVALFKSEGRRPDIGGPTHTFLHRTRGLPASTVALAFGGGALRERCDGQGRVSLLALARNVDGKPRAIQMTGLKPNGSGKRALNAEGVERLCLGPIAGCAVRLLDPLNGELAIAEGTETALAFYARHKIPAWSVLGTENMRRFRPPPHIERLVIAADNDAPGMSAASDLFDSLKDKLRVVVAPAPEGCGDWNDALTSMEGATA